LLENSLPLTSSDQVMMRGSIIQFDSKIYLFINCRHPRFLQREVQSLLPVVTDIVLIFYLDELSFDFSPLLNPNIDKIPLDTESRLSVSNDLLIDSSSVEGSDTDII
jgi:hypothetical protein